MQDLLPVTRVGDADLSQVLVLHHITSLMDKGGESLFDGGASTLSRSAAHDFNRLKRSRQAPL